MLKLLYIFSGNIWNSSKMRIIYSLLLTLSFLLLLEACSASTGTRYEKDDTPKKKEENNPPKLLDEDFDISPYKTNIDIKDNTGNDNQITDAWYGYDKNDEDSNSIDNKKIVGTVDGFRVLVVTTDDMNEANSVRDKVYKLTNGKEVYISFEPPFYKVKAGDFVDITDANNFKFKLNQLGYTEARVVQESVNLYEQ